VDAEGRRGELAGVAGLTVDAEQHVGDLAGEISTGNSIGRVRAWPSGYSIRISWPPHSTVSPRAVEHLKCPPVTITSVHSESDST